MSLWVKSRHVRPQTGMSALTPGIEEAIANSGVDLEDDD
jgi:hypothetical protein